MCNKVNVHNAHCKVLFHQCLDHVVRRGRGWGILFSSSRTRAIVGRSSGLRLVHDTMRLCRGTECPLTCSNRLRYSSGLGI